MIRFRPLILVSALALVSPLFAAGGGGGGGGGGMSGPSTSAPQYDPAAEYQKGVTALKASDYKGAKTAFDRVLAAMPKDGNSNYLAGMARVGLNDWKGASKFFQKAAKFSPDLIGTWKQLGIAYTKTKAMPKAQEVLVTLKTKASSCGPNCPQAAELADAVKAVEAAMATPVAATESKLIFASAAAGDMRYHAAVGLINEGRYDAAIKELYAAQQSFGPHPDILTYLGFANRKMKRFGEAERYYKAALAAAPDHRGATEYYGELMVERGDVVGAKAMLARLDATCRYGCTEAEELRAWIIAGRSPHS